MNATAMLSRMFDRWYRRQMARQHLLGRVRLVGKRIDAGPPVPSRTDSPPGIGCVDDAGPRIHRDG